MAATRVVLDPVTRIEGHLRVEIEVDNGVVKDAWVSGGLYRGMEAVLMGREPADAFYVAQRICGVCPVSHGHAATMAAESALGSPSRTTHGSSATSSRAPRRCTATSCGSTRWPRSTTSTSSRRLTADVGKTLELAKAAGTRVADFGAVQAAAQVVRGRRPAVDLHAGLVGTSRPTSCRRSSTSSRSRTTSRPSRSRPRPPRIIAIDGRQVPPLHDVAARRHRMGAHRGEARRHPVPARQDPAPSSTRR